MSVRWTRTSQIANGKYMEAIGWAKEVASYGTKTYNTPTINVYLDVTGQVNNIRWSCDFTDLVQFEKVQTQLLTDQSYWQLVDKAFKANLFVDGSTVDTLSRQI